MLCWKSRSKHVHSIGAHVCFYFSNMLRLCFSSAFSLTAWPGCVDQFCESICDCESCVAGTSSSVPDGRATRQSEGRAILTQGQ